MQIVWLLFHKRWKKTIRILAFWDNLLNFTFNFTCWIWSLVRFHGFDGCWPTDVFNRSLQLKLSSQRFCVAARISFFFNRIFKETHMAFSEPPAATRRRTVLQRTPAERLLQGSHWIPAVQLVELVEPVEHTEAVELAQLAELVEPAEIVELAELAEVLQRAELVELTSQPAC